MSFIAPSFTLLQNSYFEAQVLVEVDNIFQQGEHQAYLVDQAYQALTRVMHQ